MIMLLSRQQWNSKNPAYVALGLQRSGRLYKYEMLYLPLFVSYVDIQFTLHANGDAADVFHTINAYPPEDDRGAVARVDIKTAGRRYLNGGDGLPAYWSLGTWDFMDEFRWGLRTGYLFTNLGPDGFTDDFA